MDKREELWLRIFERSYFDRANELEDSIAMADALLKRFEERFYSNEERSSETIQSHCVSHWPIETPLRHLEGHQPPPLDNPMKPPRGPSGVPKCF